MSADTALTVNRALPTHTPECPGIPSLEDIWAANCKGSKTDT